MTVVTGIASSGKSSLITTAFEQNEDAILINQKPVHVSNRSNLLMYLNIFEGVRLFLVNITGLKKKACSVLKKYLSLMNLQQNFMKTIYLFSLTTLII